MRKNSQRMTWSEWDIGYASTGWLTTRRKRLLQEYYGSLEKSWNEAQHGGYLMAGLNEKETQSFFVKKEALNRKAIEVKMKQLSVSLITQESAGYPELLYQSSTPPPYLFCRGDAPGQAPALAIVGSRKMSTISQTLLAQMVPKLVGAGMRIVSGLARGVDAAAHRFTLEAGGQTIAYMGSGVDLIYPREHESLVRRIIETGGAVMSTYPLGTEARPQHFPQRNQLIAASTQGTLVMEAGEKSGSLITAQLALQENREVYAVPGNPLQHSFKGSNTLLKKGEAQMVMSALDILKDLGIGSPEATIPAIHIPKEQKALYEILSRENMTVDQIGKALGKGPQEILGQLTLMQLQGLVEEASGSRWMITARETEESENFSSDESPRGR